MKRIVTIGVVVVAFAAAPSIAAAGNSASKQQKPQVRLAPQIAFNQGGIQMWQAGNRLMY